MGKFVIGNWKMYKTEQEARSFVGEFAHICERVPPKGDLWMGLAAPFTLLSDLQKQCQNLSCPLHIGAQNMHDASQGAFTGEIALEMLLDKGAEFVILGHSERRHHFKEDDAFVNKKVLKALSRGFHAIVCIGDTEQQLQQGGALQALQEQLEKTLADVPADQTASLMIAYEPVWAIGTGQIAGNEQIEKAHAHCRSWLQQRFSGRNIPLIYGGSVNERNAAEIGSLDQVDGILVGGGSLSAREFAALTAHFAE